MQWPGFDSCLASYVGWVCVWFSSLLQEVFLQVLQFFPLLNISKFYFGLQFEGPSFVSPNDC